jgi:hypothetical protein
MGGIAECKENKSSIPVNLESVDVKKPPKGVYSIRAGVPLSQEGPGEPPPGSRRKLGIVSEGKPPFPED